MNCSSCIHTKQVKMFSPDGIHETNWKYCIHPLQQSKTPWCCRGNVLMRGTPGNQEDKMSRLFFVPWETMSNHPINPKL